jgi:hypothetical protein
MFKKKINRITVSLFFPLVLLIFVSAFSDENGAGKEGVVTYVEGSAKKQKLEDIKWANIYKDTQVIGGERVRTFTQSRAELKLAELDEVRMAPKTTIDILKLYTETKDKIREANILLQEGDLWANVSSKSTEDMSFSIGTPVAVAAITGTTLRMSVSTDSSAELKVYRGEVILSNASQSQKAIPKNITPHEIPGPYEVPGPREVSLEEWALIVKSMQKVKVDNNGRVTYSGDFSRDDEDEKTDWVLWNLTRDRQKRVE